MAFRHLFRGLLFLIVAALAGPAAFAVAYALRPAFTLEMDRPMPGVLTGFYDAERAGQDTFAWSQRQATVQLPGLDRRGAWLCVVRLRGGRADAALLPEVTLAVDGIVAVRHQTTNDFADIGVPLAPRSGSGASITLNTDTFVPGGGDTRTLGVIVDRWTCAPDSGFIPLPPRPAMRSAGIATAAFGAVLLVMSAPLAMYLVGVAAIALLQAIPLTRDLGPFSAFAMPIEWVAVGLALVLSATLLGSRVALSRSLSVAGRVALFLTFGLLYLKLAALFHPSKLVVDAVFHAHRLDWVMEGRFFFTQPMPSGVRFPYAIGLYVFAAPWAIFTTDLVSLLRIVVTAADAIGGLLIYALIARCWGDRTVGATAAVLYGLVPLTFEIVGNANLTNAFGQSASLAALAAATLLPLSWGQWKSWALLVLLCAFALLCHISTLTLLSTVLATLVLLYRFFGRPPLRREAWVIGAAFIAAGLLSVVLYYGHFAEAFRSAMRVRATSGAVSVASPLATPVSVTTRVTDAARTSVRSIGWPLFLLAMPGVVIWIRRGWRDRLGLAIASLTVTFFLFVISVAVTPVEHGFYRYALEFVTRVALATSPAIGIWAALGAVSAWRRGGLVRVAGVITVIAAVTTAGDAWIEWIR